MRDTYTDSIILKQEYKECTLGLRDDFFYLIVNTNKIITLDESNLFFLTIFFIILFLVK